MRDLMVRQKKLLDNWYAQHKNKIQAGICFFDWGKCDLFPIELFEQLEAINDTEILSQCINNYISEKGMSEVRG